jgi:hypothetical protein
VSVEVVSSISSPTELVPHLHQELEPLQEHECLERNTRQEASCLRTNPGIIYDYQEQAIKASFGHQEVRLVGINEPCTTSALFFKLLSVAVLSLPTSNLKPVQEHTEIELTLKELFLCVCVCACACVCVCVRACVCARALVRACVRF